jgi:hypothetical protein
MRTFLEFAVVIAVSAGLGFVVVSAVTGCSRDEKLVARTAIDIVRRLCAPSATVQECEETILERVPGKDGGR